MPSDDQTMSQHNSNNRPPEKPTKVLFLKRLSIGLRLLPKRARHACIAVGIGFLFIAAQTTSELMYEAIEFHDSLSADRALQAFETVLVVFQAISGFAISHSTRVLTGDSQRAMTFREKSKN
eukprot:c11185_g1_i1.p1 GENE.c11185_g1_i1~~c11185_g1_i1.p1  ORF type:complete len:122 (+),score=19.44 c11185_g1_i1:1-366(+)